MTITEIVQALSSKKKGTIFTYVIARPAKTRAKYVGDAITKTSVAQGMVGTDYANRKAVKEGVEDGIRDEVELPSHIVESFIMDGIRFWRGKSGDIYLPVCATGNRSQTSWQIGGVDTTLDEIKDVLLSSEYAKKTPTKDDLAEKGQVPFLAVKIENIAEIR
jgi:hypothetical protein